MAMEIPKITPLGKPIEGAMKRVLDRQAQKGQQQAGFPIYFNPGINPRDYVQVPQHGIVIATKETHLGKDMYDTLDVLSSEGLKMPSAERFMRHWLNVYEAAQGKRTLVYADGTNVLAEKALELWNYMSSTDRSPFQGKVCWTWFNNRFVEENGIWHMETDLKTTRQGKDVRLAGTRTRIEDCLRKDCIAKINSVNSQGFPTQE